MDVYARAFANGAALAAVISVSPALAGASFSRDSAALLQIQPAQTGLTLQVVDMSGAVVPQAHVTIVNEKTRAAIDEEPTQIQVSQAKRRYGARARDAKA
jgi:hypothetical protein